MKGTYFIAMVLLVAASSCSVRRFLPPGEKLYKGSTIVVQKNPEVKQTNKQLKKHLKQAVSPRRNKFLLGQPYKVWWWYVIGESKNERGLKPFLRKKLGEAPVLSSKVNAVVTAENMQSFMENTGYFHTTVQGDTVNISYFTEAIYTVQVQPQYHLKSITWVSDSTALLKLLEARQKRGILKVGQPYSLSNISSERDQLDLYLKTKGYYYFSPDYLMAYADSTIGNRQIDLYLNVKKTTPDAAMHPYKINKIVVYPNYSLVSTQLDTNILGAIKYDGLHIKDSAKKFKPRLFARTITYRPGRLYNSRSQNSTLNRFINLGAFKFVKNRFDPVVDSGDIYRLNVYYYLTPAKKKSFQGEVNAFTKENNSLGAQLSANWKNRNLFKGAELLTIKAYTGFEVSIADSLRNNNSYRIGGEASIRFPRYAVPFLRIKENNFYPPNTNLLLGYELYRKQLLYTKNLFRLQYDFTWKKNIRTEYTLAPLSISYLNASSITDSFYNQAVVTPAILLNVYSEAILGSYFSYTYNNAQGRRKNKFYFNASIDLSGNLAGLITGAKRYRQKTIFNTPFAQYVKTDFDLHYTRALSNKWDWANRLQVGIGLPYSNSALLPFAKQYIIGGSSSIRGFRVRNLGPGTHKPSADDQRFFQIIGGDYKFLFNTEIRVPITKSLSTAVFVDAGNIWTKDTLLFGPSGKLSKNWYKELAVATGIGLRYDVNVLIIRVDLGIPLRKPYLPDGQRWVFKQIDFGSGAWRRENLILNIALGLPF
ncbi:MAG: BamA/TamA family outer membrane protein [Chitinophagaceae bacterium]|nr:BamA/TamA family outer membrane protein [Chitinophagaceae bacterium]MBL0198749.1 BamA/TamA family outer membrane protein [Chitinophagaceae bacterium]